VLVLGWRALDCSLNLKRTAVFLVPRTNGFANSGRESFASSIACKACWLFYGCIWNLFTRMIRYVGLVVESCLLGIQKMLEVWIAKAHRSGLAFIHHGLTSTTSIWSYPPGTSVLIMR